MYRGIDGKPFIDMSSVFNMTHMNEDEIYKGIAKSKKTPRDFKTIMSKEHGCHVFIGNHTKLVTHNQHIFENDNELQYYLHLKTGNYSNFSEVVFLKTVKPSDNFLEDRHYTEKTTWTHNRKYFDSLCKYLTSDESPFDELGRILFFINYPHSITPLHTDDGNMKVEEHKYKEEHCREFIWFNIGNRKNFFIVDPNKNLEYNVDKSAVFFNDSDYHYAAEDGKFSVSLRIDGKFKPSVRRKLGLRGIY